MWIQARPVAQSTSFNFRCAKMTCDMHGEKLLVGRSQMQALEVALELV